MDQWWRTHLLRRHFRFAHQMALASAVFFQLYSRAAQEWDNKFGNRAHSLVVWRNSSQLKVRCGWFFNDCVMPCLKWKVMRRDNLLGFNSITEFNSFPFRLTFKVETSVPGRKVVGELNLFSNDDLDAVTNWTNESTRCCSSVGRPLTAKLKFKKKTKPNYKLSVRYRSGKSLFWDRTAI